MDEKEKALDATLTPAETPSVPTDTAPPAEAVPAEEVKTEEPAAEPAAETPAEAVSATEAEVEKVKQEYQAQLEKLQAKLAALEAEKIAMIRQAAIKATCEKAGFADLASVLEGATEVDEELTKRLCKYLADNQAKSAAEASAISPDGESTEDLEEVPLAQMSIDQVRQKLNRK